MTNRDSEMLPQSCAIALKEWAAVCHALREGRQLLLFRTGGIEETETGFQPAHHEFWLFPTRFHQTSDLVLDHSTIDESMQSEVPSHQLPIRDFCRVKEVVYCDNREKLNALRPWHILRDEVLDQRFEYRLPGLYVMVVETLTLPEPVIIENHNAYDGCHSWVDLNEVIPTDDLQLRVETETSIEAVRSVLSRW